MVWKLKLCEYTQLKVNPFLLVYTNFFLSCLHANLPAGSSQASFVVFPHVFFKTTLLNGYDGGVRHKRQKKKPDYTFTLFAPEKHVL